MQVWTLMKGEIHEGGSIVGIYADRDLARGHSDKPQGGPVLPGMRTRQEREAFTEDPNQRRRPQPP
jgi:hypothetical protein